MTTLEIIYNPYREVSRMMADGQPVSEHGELARYQAEPFYSWCGEILDVIARQVNDSFLLALTAPKIEREILSALAKHHPDCAEVVAKPFAVNIPAQKRVDALFSATGQKQQVSIYLLTPPGKEALCGEIKRFTTPGEQEGRAMDTPYQNVKISVYKGAPPANALPEYTLCVWLSDSFQEERQIPSLVFFQGRALAVLSVSLTGSTGFDHLNGRLYSYRCEPGKLNKVLLSFLEYACIIPLFKQKIPAQLPEKLFGVDAIEPVVRVSGPATLETGKSEKLTVSVAPGGSAVPQLCYRCAPQGIVQCTGGVIQGVTAGDAVVDAYVSGSPEPCSRFSVRVYRRNRIQKFTLCEETLELPTGIETELQFEWYPADADNTGDIRWGCSPALCQVRAVRNGVVMICGERPGEGVLSVFAEGVSASLRVKVRPVITAIRLSAGQIQLRIGQDAGLSYQFAPADAMLPDIAVTVADPSVVQYQNGRVMPRRVGETDIIFQCPQNGVRAVCRVTVTPSNGERGGLSKTIKTLLGGI